MQEFKKPWLELMKEYTNSELVIMSWSGREQAFNLERKSNDPTAPKQPTLQEFLDRGEGNPNVRRPIEAPEAEVVGKIGEVEITQDTDMRQFTGKQLFEYFKKQGANFTPMGLGLMRNTPKSKRDGRFTAEVPKEEDNG